MKEEPRSWITRIMRDRNGQQINFVARDTANRSTIIAEGAEAQENLFLKHGLNAGKQILVRCRLQPNSFRFSL